MSAVFQAQPENIMIERKFDISYQKASKCFQSIISLVCLKYYLCKKFIFEWFDTGCEILEDS